LLFYKATQIFEVSWNPPVHKQVKNVLLRLMLAGADPHKACPEFDGLTPIKALNAERSRGRLRAHEIEQMWALVLQDRELEANTAPALGPSRRQGRL
jgi:hypothetical protein